MGPPGPSIPIGAFGPPIGPFGPIIGPNPPLGPLIIPILFGPPGPIGPMPSIPPIGPPGPGTGFPSGPSIGPPLPMLIIPASMLHKVFMSLPGPNEFPEDPPVGPKKVHKNLTTYSHKLDDI